MSLQNSPTLIALFFSIIYSSCMPYAVAGAYAPLPKNVTTDLNNSVSEDPFADSAASRISPTSTADPNGGSQAGYANRVKDEDLEAVAKQKANLDDIHRNEDVNYRTTQTAVKAAEKAQAQQVGKMSPTADPVQRSNVLNDQHLVLSAKEAVKNEKAFSKKLAEQAKDPEVKKNLLLVAKGTKERDDLKKEESRLTANIAELGRLAAAAAAVANGLGEAKGPGNSQSAMPISQGKAKDTGVSYTADNKSSSVEKNADFTDAKLAAMPDKEKIALLKELESGKSKTGNKSKDLSLKNKLMAQLQAADAAERKAGGADSGVDRNGKRENAAAKVVSDVLTPPADAGADYSGKGSGGFSLANSETNAEVKRLTDEADRQLTAADDSKAGILEVESVSLFERVSLRINGCLRQHCVNSKSLAKN